MSTIMGILNITDIKFFKLNLLDCFQIIKDNYGR